MRFAGLAIVALAVTFQVGPAGAQTYDPRWPVCMKVWSGGGNGGGSEWIDCSYTSLAQCQIGASGRAAMCVINPYGALAQGAPVTKPRRARKTY